jgi:hypothetical protein
MHLKAVHDSREGIRTQECRAACDDCKYALLWVTELRLILLGLPGKQSLGNGIRKY